MSPSAERRVVSGSPISSSAGVKVLAVRMMRWSTTTPGLMVLFAIGLGIRLLLAPHGGQPGDMRLYQNWADAVSTQPWSQFVALPPPDFVHWPYLYPLYVVGSISHLFFNQTPSPFLIKLPPIVGDLGLALVVMILVERAAPGERVANPARLRWMGAAAILFNPAIIFLSSVWGQSESLQALFVLSAFALLFTGSKRWWREAAGLAVLAVELADKPQVLILLPLIFFLVWRRNARDWRNIRSGAIAAARVAGLALLGGIVAVLVVAPFGLGVTGAVSYYANLPTYEVTSAWAFNLWGTLGFWYYDRNLNPLTIVGVPAFYIGAGLFLAGSAALLVPLALAVRRRESDLRLAVVGTVALVCLAFAVLTRQHERYLYLAIPCLTVLATNRRVRWALGLLTGLFFLNLYFAYGWAAQSFGQYFPKFGPVFDLVYGTTQDSTGKVTLSAITMVACLWVAWKSWGWLAPSGAPTAASLVSEVRSRIASVGLLSRARRPARRAASWLVPPRVTVNREALIAWAMVGLAVGFGLYVLASETQPVPNPNDAPLHISMIRWAMQQFQGGHIPLDGWFPYFSMGTAQFHRYQSFPHLVTALPALLIGPDNAYTWSLYLMLALWPLSVYWGGRLMGWGRWVCAIAALVSPLLVSASGYGYEAGSYTWRGYGAWSQLWGMWFLPLAWGFGWQAVERSKHYVGGALSITVTIASHFLTGYLALLSLGVWVLARPRNWKGRVVRAAVVGGGALLVGAWVVAPLLTDASWLNESVYNRNAIFSDSYGAPTVMGWLIHGQVFDSGRWPVISLLVALGVLVCVLRSGRDPRARAVLGVFVLSLLLFFGRPSLGPLIKSLPGANDLLLHRFIMGVHLAGIYLAGVGGAWLGARVVTAVQALVSRRFQWRYLPLATTLAALAVGLAYLAPAWTERAQYDLGDAALMDQQRQYEQTDGVDLQALIDIVKAGPPGRVFAGSAYSWGRQYAIGFVPVYAELAERDADAVGFDGRVPLALTSDIEPLIDENNPTHPELYGVRYLIFPRDRRPTVKATLVAQRGRHVLWQVSDSGYIGVVDTAGQITADRTNLQQQMQNFIALKTAAPYPTVAFAGAPADDPTVVGSPPAGPAGSVIGEFSTPTDGVFTANILANRTAAVILKTSYDPRWSVTVDGVQSTPSMVAPAYLEKTVGPGYHHVEFRYQQYPYYPLLFIIGAVALAALVYMSRVLPDPAVVIQLVGGWMRLLQPMGLNARTSGDVPGD